MLSWGVRRCVSAPRLRIASRRRSTACQRASASRACCSASAPCARLLSGLFELVQHLAGVTGNQVSRLALHKFERVLHIAQSRRGPIRSPACPLGVVHGGAHRVGRTPHRAVFSPREARHALGLLERPCRLLLVECALANLARQLDAPCPQLLELSGRLGARGIE